MPQLPETPILFHPTPKEKDRAQENMMQEERTRGSEHTWEGEHEGIIALRRACKNMRNEYGELLGTWE